MTDPNTDTCPIPVDAHRTCGAALRWEVTPERDVEPYVAWASTSPRPSRLAPGEPLLRLEP
ncbi:hypothetical protein [Streptomyces sp. NPDC057748]|uniref:hypothetical protein n=1 Tax=unclassified Streptomyces TaxID=2593676 RepID=UPI003682E6B6